MELENVTFIESNTLTIFLIISFVIDYFYKKYFKSRKEFQKACFQF